MTWNLEEAHLGAYSGIAAPDSHQQLVGARHATAGEIDGARRNAYSRDPRGGQAASLPPMGAGVLSSDARHHNDLDGHSYSQVSDHPDGQFARNTALHSNYSQSGNYGLFNQKTSLGFGTGGAVQVPLGTYNVRLGEYVEETLPLGDGTAVLALSDRTARLENEKLLVKPAAERTDRSSTAAIAAGRTSWTGDQLGLMALGAYSAYSILAR